eukprot:921860-Prymnesium_polylepis.1
MDEADVLASSIGIMAAGRMRALGGGQHLKSRFGGGYHVQTKGPAERADDVARLVHDACGAARLIEAHGGSLSFEALAPFDIGGAFRTLEAAKSEGVLHNYSLSQTSLEQ